MSMDLVNGPVSEPGIRETHSHHRVDRVSHQHPSDLLYLEAVARFHAGVQMVLDASSDRVGVII